MNQKACSKCKEHKPTYEFGVLKRSPDNLNTVCKACCRDYYSVYRSSNIDKVRSYARKWRESNPDLAKNRPRLWRETNPDKQRQSEINYRKNNPDKRRVSCSTYRRFNKEKESEYRKKYCLTNRPILNAKAAKRRSAKLLATPSWINEEIVLSIYKEASILTKSTGIKHHVDHIVPLQSSIVCGLHCESNLRIVTFEENLSKGNRIWPDMP